MIYVADIVRIDLDGCPVMRHVIFKIRGVEYEWAGLMTPSALAMYDDLIAAVFLHTARRAA